MRDKLIILLAVIILLPLETAYANERSGDCFSDIPQEVYLGVDEKLIESINDKVYEELYNQRVVLPKLPCDNKLCFYNTNTEQSFSLRDRSPRWHFGSVCYNTGVRFAGKGLLVKAYIDQPMYIQHPLMNDMSSDGIFRADSDVKITYPADDSYAYNGMRLRYMKVTVPLRPMSAITFGSKISLDLIHTNHGCASYKCKRCKYDIPDYDLAVSGTVQIEPPEVTYRIQPIIVDGKFFGYNPAEIVKMPKVTVNAQVNWSKFKSNFACALGNIKGVGGKIKRGFEKMVREKVVQQGNGLANKIINDLQVKIDRTTQRVVVALGRAVVGDDLERLNLADRWTFMDEIMGERDILDQYFVTNLGDYGASVSKMKIATRSPLMFDVFNDAIAKQLENADASSSELVDGNFIKEAVNEILTRYKACPEPVGFDRNWRVRYDE